jgi:sarcosine oxidase
VSAEVLALRAIGGRVELHTTEGVRRHDRVLVCAGVGTAALAAQVGLELPVAESLHLRASFAVRDRSAPLPCVLDRDEGVYGSPFPDHRAYGIGLSSADGTGETADALAGQLARLEDHVVRARPDLVGGAIGQRLCRVTELPWGGDAFAAFRADRIVALAGTNLFKFAPILGPMLAREALGERDALLTPPATRPPRS